MLLAVAGSILFLLDPSKALARTQDASGLRGVFTGTYACGGRQFSLQLALEAAGPSEVSGVFTFFLPTGRPSDPLGAFKLAGKYDPQAHTFYLQHREWVKANPLFFPFSLSGTYDVASSTLKAKIAAAGCTPFEARLDSGATADASRAASERAKRYDLAPTALADATNPVEECEVLGKWVARFKREYKELDIPRTLVDTLYTYAANLFADEVFVPVFGKRIDQLSDADRAAPRRAIQNCSQAADFPEDRTMYGVVLVRAFLPGAGGTPGSFDPGDVASIVAARRTLRRQRAALLTELKSLSVSESAFQRALSVRDEDVPTYQVLWPSEYAELKTAADNAASRIATPLLATWIANVVKSAAGFEGLAQLGDVIDLFTAGTARADTSPRPTLPHAPAAPAPATRFDKNRPALVAAASPQSRAQAESNLRARASALTTELIQAERAKLATLGSGLTGLHAGTIWYEHIVRSFGRFGSEPSVGAVLQDLQARRRPDLLASAMELTARINAAKTSLELTTVMSTYLGVPTDRDEPALSPVFAAAAAKDRALTAAAEQAAAERRSVAYYCKTKVPVTSPPATGEPSVHDLCLALADVMESMNGYWRSLLAACRSGDYRTNAMLGAECISLCLASFATCELWVRMTGFQKRACVRAGTLEGFNCTYNLQWTVSTAALSKAIGLVFPTGGWNTDRFISRGDRWVRIER